MLVHLRRVAAGRIQRQVWGVLRETSTGKVTALKVGKLQEHGR